MFDIDDIWDNDADIESKMIDDWKAAIANKNEKERIRLVNECVKYKAIKYRMLAMKQLQDNDNCNDNEKKIDNDLTNKIVLCQSHEQAVILLGKQNNNDIIDEKLEYHLIPEAKFHLQNMKNRKDEQWVIDLCVDQRDNLVKFEKFETFDDFSQLEKNLLNFANIHGLKSN